MASNTERGTTQPTNSSLMRRLLHGQVITSDFFARNWLVMAAIVFISLTYIGNKYTCKIKMEQVQQLKKELEIVNADKIRARSRYMGRIRESAMQELVDTMHLNLHVQDTPPYQLPKDSER